MPIRHQGDMVLDHPGFSVTHDPTGRGSPAINSFSDWSFDDTASVVDTPSVFQDGGNQLATFNIVDLVDLAPQAAILEFELNDGAKVDLLSHIAERTSDVRIDSFDTLSGENSSTSLLYSSDYPIVSGPFAPQHQNPSLLFDHTSGAQWLTSSDGSSGWLLPNPAAISGDMITHSDHSTGSFGSDTSGITLIDTDFFAKGGNPGAPGGGGGPGGGGSGSGGGDSGVLAEYSAGSADGDAGYDILIDFKGSGWTTDLQAAFTQAADYFTTVITDDIGGGGRYHGTIIDDLYVTAELTSIDGTGGVLGQAGPTAVWTANELTAAGQMQFDVADAQSFFEQGLWSDIVTHEFMHVLGFGSLWNYGDHQLVSGYEYQGEFGLAAYKDAVDPNATFIPVEDGGGSGTAGSHWDEQALGNELMTGYINTQNYLSEFSVVSLADLGYNVEYQSYESMPVA